MEVDARSITTPCLLDYCYILTTTQACSYCINNNTFTNILLLWFCFSKVLVFVLLFSFFIF